MHDEPISSGASCVIRNLKNSAQQTIHDGVCNGAADDVKQKSRKGRCLKLAIVNQAHLLYACEKVCCVR
jgi:hypothetical protein